MKLYRYFFNTYNNFNIEVKEIPVEKETPGTYQINFAGRKQILKSKIGVALTDWVTYGAECFLLQKNLSEAADVFRKMWSDKLKEQAKKLNAVTEQLTYLDNLCEEQAREEYSLHEKKIDKKYLAPEKYLTAELCSQTKYKSLRDAYDRNNLSVIVRGSCWYTEGCPDKLMGMLKREMKRLYPQYKHLHDQDEQE